MPLWLLGTIVVIGLAAVLVALIVFGFTEGLTLTRDSATHEFTADNPGLTPRDIVLAENGRAALVDADARYLIWCMGADIASHRLTGARIKETPKGLTIRLPDYAAPRVRLLLSEAERVHWKSLIEEAA